MSKMAAPLLDQIVVMCIIKQHASTKTNVWSNVTVMQLNGSDLVVLLSLYCQPCARWSKQVVSCRSGSFESINHFLLDITESVRGRLLSNQAVLYDARIRNGIVFYIP